MITTAIKKQVRAFTSPFSSGSEFLTFRGRRGIHGQLIAKSITARVNLSNDPPIQSFGKGINNAKALTVENTKYGCERSARELLNQLRPTIELRGFSNVIRRKRTNGHVVVIFPQKPLEHSTNILPEMFAEWLAESMQDRDKKSIRWYVDKSIGLYQPRRLTDRELSLDEWIHRFLAPMLFFDLKSGRHISHLPYQTVLVDDQIGSGKTMATLASYVEKSQGEVLAMADLGSQHRLSALPLKPNLVLLEQLEGHLNKYLPFSSNSPISRNPKRGWTKH